MKRSEMLVDVILECLEGHFENVDPKALPENLLAYTALDILDSIERAGMIPPAYLKPTNHPIIPGDIPMGNGKFGTPTFEWESEDEA